MVNRVNIARKLGAKVHGDALMAVKNSFFRLHTKPLFGGEKLSVLLKNVEVGHACHVVAHNPV